MTRKVAWIRCVCVSRIQLCWAKKELSFCRLRVRENWMDERASDISLSLFFLSVGKSWGDNYLTEIWMILNCPAVSVHGDHASPNYYVFWLATTFFFWLLFWQTLNMFCFISMVFLLNNILLQMSTSLYWANNILLL